MVEKFADRKEDVARLDVCLRRIRADWQSRGNMQRLWQRDATLWTGTDEDKWLGWLDIVDEQIAQLQADRFAEHEVVLPVVVITELEGKRHHPELGYFARSALRMLDELRVENGRLDEPVPVGDEGGTVRAPVQRDGRIVGSVHERRGRPLLRFVSADGDVVAGDDRAGRQAPWAGRGPGGDHAARARAGEPRRVGERRRVLEAIAR